MLNTLVHPSPEPTHGPGAMAGPVTRDPVIGRVGLAFESDPRQGGRLTELYHKQPLRVLFPHPRPGDSTLAAIACVSGGLVGGDLLETSVEMAPGARAFVMGQAAEKVYRSTGASAQMKACLSLSEGALLEWLPQETILFEGARLKRISEVRLAEGATLLAGDILVFGRTARGERFTRGFLHDEWALRDAHGRLLWKDVFRLTDNIAARLDHPAGLDGAVSYATLICHGPKASGLLAAIREALCVPAPGLLGGATRIDNLVLTRMMGRDALVLRDRFADIWTLIRARLAGLPPRMPRLWEI